MRFTDVFIRRPVFATTVSLLLLLVGVISFFNLHVRAFPKITPAVVNVTTTYSGANAKLMEGFVTTPIEEAISGVEGIDYIESSSSQGRSKVSVHMKLGYDINTAMSDVSSKVDSARWKLPKEVNDPIISKRDPNAQASIIVAFMSDTLSPEDVTDYLIRFIQPKLQNVPGVSQAQIYGAREYSMHIMLDPELMAAHHVTASDVQQALQSHNVQSASGRIEGKTQEFTVYSTTDLHTPAQFNNIPIRQDQGRIVRIKDIGLAKLGPSDDRVSVIMNGKKARIIGIMPKSTANPLSVSKAVRNLLPEIRKNLPKGLKVRELFDMSTFISNSLKEVIITIAMAAFFVFLVIFLMIGSFRAVLIPLVTIPLSIIGVNAIMLAFGYSINTLTLLAWVLAIGLVVDDAIVVLENIYRHLAGGMSAKEAAIIGAREISFAVIAMTLTLAAVYAPIGFTTGLTGKLFTQFAFTLAGAVIVSGFIALTLTPMMCSNLFRGNYSMETGYAGFVDRLFDKLRVGYKAALHFVFKWRYIVLIFAAVVYASCYFLFVHTPAELAPPEDQGALIGFVEAPAAANLYYTEQHTKQLESIYASIPEIVNYGIINGAKGVNSAVSFIILKPLGQRTRSAMEIKNQLFPLMWSIPGIIAMPNNFPALPGAGGFHPISYVLKTTASYKDLNNDAQKFVQALSRWSGLTNVRSNLNINQPQTVVNVHRNEAADLGISMNQIAQTLNLFLAKPTMTRFEMNGRSYDVLPQLYPQYRNTPDELNDLNVRTQSGELVPISNLVDIQEEVIPQSLPHFEQLRAAKITAGLSPGVTQGEALDYMNNLAKKILPKNVHVGYSGQLRQYVQASGKMGDVFIFALIFIYLILAAQFESFRDPLIVMLSVPLAIAGALVLLKLTHGTLNIYTKIGLVTLVGLITKAGILIVEFANQQQEKGLSIHEAIVEAATHRLRPILMTTTAMVLSALALVFASGAGAESRHQMGIVIVGGMLFGTILSLFVVPTAYYMFAARIQKMEDKN